MIIWTENPKKEKNRDFTGNKAFFTNSIMDRRSKPAWQLKIAKERIDILFKEAQKTKEKKLQNRYVELARKIGMRYNVKIESKYRRKYCRYCYAYLTSKRRLVKGNLVVNCIDCKKTNRYPYK